MADDPPKAFVSHASEDKQRFAVNFAERLRAVGIDAWFDQWELVGGDSLVDRIFEQGIGGAEAVIVVLSHVSVTKPWVREELNAAVVKRIETQARLIPVLIDEGVEIPVALKHLVYLDLGKLGIDGVVDGVARTIFGHVSKPPIGQPPGYAISALDESRYLDDPIDDVVLDAIVTKFRNHTGRGRLLLRSNGIEETVAAKGVSHEVFVESMEALIAGWFIEADRFAGPGNWMVKGVSSSVWLQGESRNGLDVDLLRRSMLSDLVNDPAATTRNWAIREDVHPLTVAKILEEFASNGWIKTTESASGSVRVFNVSPLAARALRGLD